MKTKRKPYMVKDQGGINGPLLSHMRKVAYHDSAKEARMTISINERMHDDDSAEAAAQLKRDRKNAKRLREAGR